MKKKSLLYINLVLGSLIALFSGCKAQKSATKTAEPKKQPQEEVSRMPENRPVCLYGVPPAVYRQLHEQQTDTVATESNEVSE